MLTCEWSFFKETASKRDQLRSFHKVVRKQLYQEREGKETRRATNNNSSKQSVSQLSKLGNSVEAENGNAKIEYK
jgi:hypothetical protein